jgi:peptide deformylase
MLDIIKYPDPVLRRRAEEVQKLDDAIRQLLEEMIDTMYVADGVGLAAPQVGVSKRIIVLDDGDGLMHLINPVLTAPENGEHVTTDEGCLSLPEIRTDVTRPSQIHVEALDENFQPVSFDADGLLARVIQHETDHLNGVLIIDHASTIHRQLMKPKLRRLEKEYADAV